MASNAFNIANVALNTNSPNVTVSAFTSNLSVAGNIIAQYGYVLASNVQVSNAIIFSDGTQLTTASSGLALFDYVGNGSTTSFSTGNYYATTVLDTNVYMGGLYQRKNQYTWTGTNIVFNNPPPNQVNVEIMIQSLATPINVPAPASVYPASMSQGGPSWDSSGNVTISGNAYASSYQLTTQAPLASPGLYLTGTNTISLVTNATNQVSVNATGQLLNNIADTAAAPGFSWAGKTNTGLFSPSASVLALSTNGLERVRVNSSGNVGIGTANPTSPLQVQGNVNVNNGNIFNNGQQMASVIQVLTYNLAL